MTTPQPSESEIEKSFEILLNVKSDAAATQHFEIAAAIKIVMDVAISHLTKTAELKTEHAIAIQFSEAFGDKVVKERDELKAQLDQHVSAFNEGAKFSTELIQSQQLRIQELDAQAVKLKLTIGPIYEKLCSLKMSHPNLVHLNELDSLKQALATTAGQSTLKRIEALEEALGKIRDDTRKPLPEVAIYEFIDIAKSALEGSKQ